MRFLMASAAVCALLTTPPVSAQTTEAVPDGSDVYRNDLPETHEGVDLPELSVGSSAELPADLLQPFTVASAGALAAQQFGNLAASKQASGAVRDLGDRMVLLHSAINERFDALGERDETRLGPQAQLMSENVRADMEVLDQLRGEPFDTAFTTWVTNVYPELIEAWSRLGESQSFAELSQAVVPRLETHLAVAERVLAGQDGAAASGLEGAGAEDQTEGSEGAEGQTGERQHTPETEQPAVQSGQNYVHEQVEVDPQSETASLPDDLGQPDVAPAAGELDILNPAVVFSLLENFSTELAQLEQAPDFAADRIRVVSLGEHLSELELETLDSSILEHQSNVAQARDAVNSRQAMTDALSEAGVSAENLVAFDVLDEGIVLFTRTGQPAQ